MLFLGTSGWNRQLEFGFWDLEFNRWNCRAPSPRSLIESGRRCNLGGDDDRTGNPFAFQKDLFRMLKKGQLHAAPFFNKSPFAPIVAGRSNLYAITGAGKSTWQPHRDFPLIGNRAEMLRYC